MKTLLNRRVLFAAAFVPVVSLLPGAALGQSCLNNSNPNLAKNGGFESGSERDVPGWTIEWKSKVDKNVFLNKGNAHGGSQDLALGSIYAPNDIVQNIDGTQAGNVYTICFWLNSSPNLTGGVTTFDILWNNVSVLQLSNSGGFGYQYFAANVLALGGGADFLRVRERNNQGFYYIDDVAVQLCSGCGLDPDRISSKDEDFRRKADN